MTVFDVKSVILLLSFDDICRQKCDFKADQTLFWYKVVLELLIDKISRKYDSYRFYQ